MSCVVQGYEEEVEREQLARNVAYLDQPEIVCGEPLRNITPHLLALLTVTRTPFYFGGTITHAHLAQFLWACHRDYSPRAWWKRRQLIHRASRLDLAKANEEISAFIELTFMDMPRGGDAEKPIASGTAWLVYRFRNPPWNQAEQITLHTPFRKLYQELRCWQREQGEHIASKSDIKKSNWLDDVQRALDSGEITQAQLDAWNAKHRNN